MQCLKQDFKAYRDYSGSLLKTLLNYNFYIVLIFRLSHFFSSIKLQILARLFWLINRLIFTVDIDPRANLGGGLLLVHGMCIVIGEKVKIIGPVKIYQGVTIGGNNFKTKFYNGQEISQPIIMQDVVIGINSCILGPCIIGNKAVVGTGAIITKDVEENRTVIGINKMMSI